MPTANSVELPNSRSRLNATTLDELQEERRMTRHADFTLEWVGRAQEYCSRIEYGAATNVHVFRRPETEPCLVLKNDRREGIGVVDAAGRQTGLIRTERRLLLPRYVLQHDSTILWKISVRSIFRNRHTLEIAGDTTWSMRTPFFSVDFAGDAEDGAKVLGRVGERTYEWLWLVEPGRDSDAFLSAVAFMHRQWYLC